MRAPKNAVSVRSMIGRTTGVNEVTFKLRDGSKTTCLYYKPYPKKVDMPGPRDLLVDMWEMLDNSVNNIKSPVGGDASQIEWHKARGRAQAEIIAMIMSAFYPDADAVTREALARWKARTAGEPHETPGLAEDIWNPAPSAPEKRAPKPTGNRIPDSAVDTVRQGITLGMFTKEQMASTYSVTVAELVEQLGLD